MTYPAVAGTGYASTIRKPREEAFRGVCIVGALSVEESEAPVRRRMPRPGWRPTCTLRGYPLEPSAQHQRDRAEQLLGHWHPSPLRLYSVLVRCGRRKTLRKIPFVSLRETLQGPSK